MFSVLMLLSCGNKPKVDMVSIPGTNIKMLKTEVTQKLYTSVMGRNPSYFMGDNLPVESVSWYDAIDFCNKLSEMMGLIPVYSYTFSDVIWNVNANGFRLPTVAEWEYSARGGKNYKYAGSNNIDKVAWHYENSNGKTHPVAKKKANSYGLYDMNGNVIEWCWDSAQYESGRDGRKYRGGSWRWDGMANDYADHRDNTIGFRVVRNKK